MRQDGSDNDKGHTPVAAFKIIQKAINAIKAGPASGAYSTDFVGCVRPCDPHNTGKERADFGAVDFQSTKPTVKITRWREQSMENDRSRVGERSACAGVRQKRAAFSS